MNRFVQGVLSLLYLTTTQVYVLINYTAFAESLAVAASVGGLLYLRIKQPNLSRPIKVNLALPIVFFVTCLFLVLLPLYVSPYETGISIAIVLSGIPVYFLTVYWKNKPRVYQKAISKLYCSQRVQLISISCLLGSILHGFRSETIVLCTRGLTSYSIPFLLLDLLVF